VAHGEPHTENRRPSPLFITQCDGGPPAMDRLGTPDQGTRSRPKWSLGQPGREIKPTMGHAMKRTHGVQLPHMPRQWPVAPNGVIHGHSWAMQRVRKT
jgi:hypothetical protein